MASELILYGQYLSPGTMRVAAVLNEKKLDFKFVEIDLVAEEHKKEPFLSLNPLGMVPAFKHGDLTLFESRAITSYLAHAFADSGTQLIIPDDHKRMAITTMWMEVEAHQFNQPTYHLAWELVFKPLTGNTPNEVVVKENEAKLDKLLDIYEARLSNSKYLGGDEYSLADLYHIPHIWYLMEVIPTTSMELFVSRPHINDWRKDIMGRPAWLQVDELGQKLVVKFNEDFKKNHNGLTTEELEKYKEEFMMKANPSLARGI